MADAKQEQLWVLRAQVGSRDALDALFRAVQTPLYRYLAGLLGDRTLAEDVLQEVLLRIYRKIAWLREPGLFRPWCYRIATREAFKRLPRERRWAGHIRDPVLLETVPAPEPTPAPEMLARLPELLRHVSPASRAVLALHYLDELSIDEVACVLDIAPGTAKSRLAYGLSVLRRQLADEGGADRERV